LLQERLGHKQPVELVFVPRRKSKSNQPSSVRGKNRQNLKTVLVEPDVDEFLLRPVQPPLANADLDRDLPVGCRAYQDFIRGILNLSPGCVAQLRVTLDVPIHGVRIEQQPHDM
jgi:hypothetical protein